MLHYPTLRIHGRSENGRKGGMQWEYGQEGGACSHAGCRKVMLANVRDALAQVLLQDAP